MPCPNIMDTAQPDQPAVKINRLTRRSRLVLILTLLIAAFMRFDRPGPLVGITSVLIIIDVADITLLWLVTYRYFNFTAALIAGMMYALSPWSLWYTQLGLISAVKMPLLVAFACAMYAQVEYKRWAWFISLLAALAAIGMFGVIIGTYYTERHSNTLSLDSLVLATQIATGIGIENVIDHMSESANLLTKVARPSELWLLLIGGAAVIGFPALWFRSRLAFSTIALWVIIPILVFTTNWITLYPDYFIPSLPALCILAGAGVAWLIKLMPGKPYSRMIILAAYSAVFLSQALWWRGVVRYLELTAR